MADEQQPLPAGTLHITPGFPVEQKYANFCQVDLSDGDITLRFGITGNPASLVFPTAAVTLTHANFKKITEVMVDASAILDELYGGSVPASLVNLTAEQVEAAKESVARRQSNASR